MPSITLPFIVNIPSELTQEYHGHHYFVWPLGGVNKPQHHLLGQQASETQVEDAEWEGESDSDDDSDRSCGCFECAGYPAAPFEFSGYQKYSMDLFGHKLHLSPNGEASVFVNYSTDIQELTTLCRGLATKLSLLWKWAFELQALHSRNFDFLKTVLKDKLWDRFEDPLRFRSGPEGLNDRETQKAIDLWHRLCSYGQDAVDSVKTFRCKMLISELEEALLNNSRFSAGSRWFGIM